MKSDSPAGKLLQSGIIFAAASFLTTLVHYGFQMIISRQLGQTPGEFGLMNSTITFVGFLGLPLAIASQTVTHYIARFHFSRDSERLHGLLAGCRRFLLHITLAGSVLAIVLIKPLGDFFHLPRASLTLIALLCVLGGLWGSYVTALCQGLAWFKRLAGIGLLAATLRVLFGWQTTKIWPVAEWAVAASLVMLLANLILLFWKKDFPGRAQTVISPWDREFVRYLVVSAACVLGSSCFTQGDLLVAKRYFPAAELDAYAAAGLLARGLPTVVGPLLAVLFTYRSSRQHTDALPEQLKLLGLYAGTLLFGAGCLFVLREFCLHLLHQDNPTATGMIPPLAATMVFVGLLQALGLWALASRWLKISLLYGVLGVGYWFALLFLGQSPADLLRVLPLAAGGAFAVIFIVWLIAMRGGKIQPAA